MARTVKEWVGKSDDANPPRACKQRILARQDGKCAVTGKPFTPKEKPQFDHIVPLWLGGENRESNLQAIHGEPHKRKTATEAAVRAKVNANAAKHLGLTDRRKQKIPTRPQPPRPAPKLDFTKRRSLFVPKEDPHADR
jgi:5-methylcytosine-specific restriction endonuclease McrA